MKTAGKKQSYTRLVWKQYRRDKVAILGLVFVLILFVMALGAPFLAGSRPIAAVVDGDLVFPAVTLKARLMWDQAREGQKAGAFTRLLSTVQRKLTFRLTWNRPAGNTCWGRTTGDGT